MKERGTQLLEADLTRSVIACFYQVHRALGFGFREYIYAIALERELVDAGHHVDREVGVTVYYHGRPLARQVLDMIVDSKLVLEIKTGDRPPPGGTAQLYSYLCATDLELGLLLFFGPEPKFYRVIFENRLKRRESSRV